MLSRSMRLVYRQSPARASEILCSGTPPIQGAFYGCSRLSSLFSGCYGWLFFAVIASPAFAEREHFRGFRRSAGCKFAAFNSEIRVTVTVSFGAIVAEFALLFRPALIAAPF